MLSYATTPKGGGFSMWHNRQRLPVQLFQLELRARYSFAARHRGMNVSTARMAAQL